MLRNRTPSSLRTTIAGCASTGEADNAYAILSSLTCWTALTLRKNISTEPSAFVELDLLHPVEPVLLRWPRLPTEIIPYFAFGTWWWNLPRYAAKPHQADDDDFANCASPTYADNTTPSWPSLTCLAAPTLWKNTPIEPGAFVELDLLNPASLSCSDGFNYLQRSSPTSSLSFGG